MHSREQYLDKLREEYWLASKKQKKRLLNEARHWRIRAQPGQRKRPPRKATYGADVLTELVKIWELDSLCGQSFAPALREPDPSIHEIPLHLPMPPGMAEPPATGRANVRVVTRSQALGNECGNWIRSRCNVDLKPSLPSESRTAAD